MSSAPRDGSGTPAAGTGSPQRIQSLIPYEPGGEQGLAYFLCTSCISADR